MGMRKPPYRGILHDTVHGLCPKEQKMALITCADCGNLISSEAPTEMDCDREITGSRLLSLDPSQRSLTRQPGHTAVERRWCKHCVKVTWHRWNGLA